MNKKWFAMGCLTSVLIIILIFTFLALSLRNLGRPKQPKITAGSYLHVNLTGMISEYEEITDGLFPTEFMARPTSAHSLIRKINKAAEDPNIEGMILESEYASAGLATVMEIQEALKHFQSQGKEIQAYINMGSTMDYLISSIADKIYLNPSASAGILFTGIGSTATFYKNMLDKIGVDIHVMQAGDFKGAGEQFTQTEYSEPFLQSLELVIETLYQDLLETIAENRQLDEEMIRYIFEERDELFVSNSQALEYGLVDELIYKDDLYDHMNIERDRLVSVADYRANLSGSFATNTIAVVYAQGMIAPSTSEYSQYLSAHKINNILDRLEENPLIKAIVLRINSPGGSALESEIILDKLKKVSKPVIVSMSNTAASGGYYIASNADMIVASKFTLTGSIGVVSMLPSLDKLGDKIGITTQRVSRGKFSNMYDMWNEPEENFITAMQHHVDTTYDEFKQRVAEGRNLDMQDVEEVAQGRIWLATHALDNNLVDMIGTMQDAISLAADAAEITDYSVRFYPEQKSMWEMLIKSRFGVESLIPTILGNSELNFLRQSQEMYHYLMRHDYIHMILPYYLDISS
jgi:protease-4